MFSVVIPLYNKELTIINTLNSVFNQNYKNYEVIVIDDGSTDKSLQLAKTFTDERLRIYSNTHKGVSEARNFGVQIALFEFVAFLDADDAWEAEYLSEMLQLIIKYPDCAMYGSAYKVIKKSQVDIVGNIMQEGIINDYFKERLRYRIMRTSATIVRKNIIIQTGGFPSGMIGGEDEYAWLKIVLNYKIAFTPKILATYNNQYSSFLWRRGQADSCKEAWFDFYEQDNYYKNEFIAQKAIIAGIRYAYGSSKAKSKEIERQTKYTQLSRANWYYLYLLNRFPILIANALYKLNRKYNKIISFFKPSENIEPPSIKSLERERQVNTKSLSNVWYDLLD